MVMVLGTAHCRERVIRQRRILRAAGHNEKAIYTEKPHEYVAVMERLLHKFNHARTLVPAPVLVRNSGAKVGVIAYGSSDFAVVESLDQIKKEKGIEVDYLRLRAYPFAAAVEEFIAKHDRVYIVEQDRDAQLHSLIKLDIQPELVTRLRSILHYDGLPIDARSVTESFVSQEGI